NVVISRLNSLTHDIFERTFHWAPYLFHSSAIDGMCLVRRWYTANSHVRIADCLDLFQIVLPRKCRKRPKSFPIVCILFYQPGVVALHDKQSDGCQSKQHAEQRGGIEQSMLQGQRTADHQKRNC